MVSINNNNISTLIHDYKNDVKESKKQKLTSVDFDTYCESINVSSGAGNYSFEEFISDALNQEGYGDIDFDKYFEEEGKNVYIFETTDGEYVRIDLEKEKVEILTKRELADQLDLLDGNGTNSIVDDDNSININKLSNLNVVFERDKIVLEGGYDYSTTVNKTDLDFSDTASKPLSGSITAQDVKGIYESSLNSSGKIDKNKLDKSVEDLLIKETGFVKPAKNNGESDADYETRCNIALLSKLTGKQYSTVAQDYMENQRLELYDAIIDTISDKIKESYENKDKIDEDSLLRRDGQIYYREGTLEGITFSESDILANSQYDIESLGGHVDTWDKMTSEKAKDPEFIKYANKLFYNSESSKEISADDITVYPNGNVSIKTTSAGSVNYDITDASMVNQNMTAQQIDNYYDQGVKTGLSTTQINYLDKNKETITSNVNYRASYKTETKDGITHNDYGFKGLTFSAPPPPPPPPSPPPSSWDPMGFEEDGVRYDFVEDENNDGVFNGKEEFVGFDKFWADIVKYDTDGNGKIEGSELNYLKVLVNGEIVTASSVNISEIDLGSRKEINEINEDGNLLASVFDVKINNHLVTAEQTFDTLDYLNREYGDDFGKVYF